MRIADDRIRSDQNGVAVRLASSGAINSNIPVRACSVLNKDLLAKAAREVVGDEASRDIGRPACCKRNHDAHGPIWPVLRPDSDIGHSDQSEGGSKYATNHQWAPGQKVGNANRATA